MKDIFGRAIIDYYDSEDDIDLVLHNSYGSPEELPVEVFFRGIEDLTSLEQKAIELCKGSILDVGAGAGALSLIMQAEGKMVTPLESSQGCIQVMEKIGLLNITRGDFWKHEDRYDTLLIMMNGLGLAGQLKGIKPFLNKCKECMNPQGQILIDSSDIEYLYEEGISKPTGYYGEIKYKYEYKNEAGEWFDWLYLDCNTLIEQAEKLGLKTEIVMVDEHDQYLARITKA